MENISRFTNGLRIVPMRWSFDSKFNFCSTRKIILPILHESFGEWENAVCEQKTFAILLRPLLSHFSWWYGNRMLPRMTNQITRLVSQAVPIVDTSLQDHFAHTVYTALIFPRKAEARTSEGLESSRIDSEGKCRFGRKCNVRNVRRVWQIYFCGGSWCWLIAAITRDWSPFWIKLSSPLPTSGD
jgi:hypothetical protein